MTGNFCICCRRGTEFGLAAAIAQRNQAEPVWAFKIPSIHGYLEPRDLGLFRNPHLIVVMRDIVATARRHATSEHMDPAWSLLETARGQADLLVFLTNAGCPILSLSYEKAVLHPEIAVQAVADFANIPIADDQRLRLAALIEPDNRVYAQTATRRFDGNLDGIFQGRLVGWCRNSNDPAPVSLDLLVNGVARGSFPADHFRDDLKQAGIGEGNHGFDIDTRPLGLSPGAVLALRVTGRTFILPGSGKAAWMYHR